MAGDLVTLLVQYRGEYDSILDRSGDGKFDAADVTDKTNPDILLPDLENHHLMVVRWQDLAAPRPSQRIHPLTRIRQGRGAPLRFSLQKGSKAITRDVMDDFFGWIAGWKLAEGEREIYLTRLLLAFLFNDRIDRHERLNWLAEKFPQREGTLFFAALKGVVTNYRFPRRYQDWDASLADYLTLIRFWSWIQDRRRGVARDFPDWQAVALAIRRNHWPQLVQAAVAGLETLVRNRWGLADPSQPPMRFLDHLRLSAEGIITVAGDKLASALPDAVTGNFDLGILRPLSAVEISWKQAREKVADNDALALLIGALSHSRRQFRLDEALLGKTMAATAALENKELKGKWRNFLRSLIIAQALIDVVRKDSLAAQGKALAHMRRRLFILYGDDRPAFASDVHDLDRLNLVAYVRGMNFHMVDSAWVRRLQDRARVLQNDQGFITLERGQKEIRANQERILKQMGRMLARLDTLEARMDEMLMRTEYHIDAFALTPGPARTALTQAFNEKAGAVGNLQGIATQSFAHVAELKNIFAGENTVNFRRNEPLIREAIVYLAGQVGFDGWIQERLDGAKKLMQDFLAWTGGGFDPEQLSWLENISFKDFEVMARLIPGLNDPDDPSVAPLLAVLVKIMEGMRLYKSIHEAYIRMRVLTGMLDDYGRALAIYLKRIANRPALLIKEWGDRSPAFAGLMEQEAGIREELGRLKSALAQLGQAAPESSAIREPALRGAQLVAGFEAGFEKIAFTAINRLSEKLREKVVENAVVSAAVSRTADGEITVQTRYSLQLYRNSFALLTGGIILGHGRDDLGAEAGGYLTLPRSDPDDLNVKLGLHGGGLLMPKPGGHYNFHTFYRASLGMRIPPLWILPAFDLHLQVGRINDAFPDFTAVEIAFGAT